MTRTAFLLLGIIIGLGACNRQMRQSVAGEGSDEAGTAAAETAAVAAQDPMETGCHATAESHASELIALLERAATISTNTADGVISMTELRRRPMSEATREALFGSLPEVEELLQLQVFVTPQDEPRSFVLMHDNNSHRRSERRFQTRVGAYTAEARAGQHIDADTEVSTTACWFDLEVERDVGGTYGIGVILAVDE